MLVCVFRTTQTQDIEWLFGLCPSHGLDDRWALGSVLTQVFGCLANMKAGARVSGDCELAADD
jgi:hypothetical protein